MDKKLLILCVSLVILTLITVPVMAPEPPTSGPINLVFAVVKDIQTNVNTLLTNLADVQSDLTTIQSTTETIENKLDTPPNPTRYEYYATWYNTYGGTNKYVYYGVMNWGNYPANVTICPDLPCEDCQSWHQNGKSGRTYGEPIWGDSYRISITTDSPFVEPILVICKNNRTEFSQYDVDTRFLPGDFLKVEIYE